ncbi:copper ion binding [Halocaridina rubra]|uniref:Copper ion binding n=1 Tax=Halocaridina rubra TaxID=373956 RepID=A0AAN8WKS9_HALRR
MHPPSSKWFDATYLNIPGNVQIFHENRWENICDDEWDDREGEIICRQLGYPGLQKITNSGKYGHTKGTYWLDNLFCYGTEQNLTECRHDGWGIHDCELSESAGVVCKSDITSTTTAIPTLPPRDQPIINDKVKIAHKLEGKLKLRVVGGRTDTEGRVEVLLPGMSNWTLICGDGWTLFEAMVVCKHLDMGYAQGATSAGFFGGNSSDIAISGVKCTGNEERLDQCLHDVIGDVFCPNEGPEPSIAGVTCVPSKYKLSIFSKQ